MNSTTPRPRTDREIRAYLQLPLYDCLPVIGNPDRWEVRKRESQGEPYVVNAATGSCSCPDHAKGHVCKHWRMVNIIILAEQAARPAPSPVAVESRGDRQALATPRHAAWEARIAAARTMPLDFPEDDPSLDHLFMVP